MDAVFAVFTAFFGFALVVVRLGLNAVGFSSIGGLAAVLKAHAFEVQASSIACGGAGQLQPINVTDKTPTRNILMQFYLLARGVSRAFLERWSPRCVQLEVNGTGERWGNTVVRNYSVHG